MKIVNLDGFTTNPGDLSWEQFQKYGDVTVYDRTSPNQVIERAKDADVLIVNKTPIDANILKQLPKLKYVGLQSTGYNIIDCDAAKEFGITVTNIPSYSTSAVAQLVFAFILEITNQVALHSQAVHNDEWVNSPDFCFWKTKLMELNGKTIGIVGFGSIGRKVAEIAEAFGMNVLAYSPHPKDKENLKTLQFVSLDELLSLSDVITCHCPLNENTTNLINKETIAKMKKSAIFVNTSRGSVVDETALANALNNDEIMAAGVDVLSVEPAQKDNPLLTAKNCFITPHIAWASFETRQRLMSILENNLKCYLDGDPINVVNK